MSSILMMPRVLLEVEGAVLSESDTRYLESVLVKERLSVPTLCELTFKDSADVMKLTETLVPGASFQVRLEGYRVALFSGEVTAIQYVHEPNHGREVRVRGYDLLHRLRKRQPVRAHVQVTLADLCREMVADLGLSVDVMEDGPLWQHVIQHWQSDFDLLVGFAEQCGMYLTLRDKTLHLVTLAGLGTPLPLVLGESLLEARLEINGDPACRSVAVTGWDSSRAERHDGKAEQSRLGREVASEVLPQQLGGTGEYNRVDEGASNDEHAASIAQATLDWETAREVSFWGVAQGDPGLLPGAPVEVRGVAGLAGRYVITSVDHTLDRRKGFVSEISSLPPARQLRVNHSLTAPGIVTRIDDPEKLGRVRVSLPSYGGVETDWMCVLFPAAGKGKGFVGLYDVGDQVLVLFAHQDPAQGLVLGGLYGAEAPPDLGIEGGLVARYTILTPGGQRAMFDDSRKMVRLINSEGSFVEIAPEKVLIHSKTDLVIEAPGRSIVIQADTIDFRRV